MMDDEPFGHAATEYFFNVEIQSRLQFESKRLPFEFNRNDSIEPRNKNIAFSVASSSFCFSLAAKVIVFNR